MNTLRKLTSILVVSLLLGLPAFAGETQTPPCSPNAGEIQTPPCQAEANGDPGDPTPSAARELLTEITAEVLKDILSIL